MTVAWSDLGGALIAGLIWVAIIAAALALLVWDARRRKVASVVVDVTGAAARIWVALVIVGMIAGLVGLLVSPTTSISDLPVHVDWPAALPCQSGGEQSAAPDALYCARLTAASTEITALDAGLKVLLFGGGLLTYVVWAAPGVLVAALCGLVAAGTPFAQKAHRWLLAAAITILTAGMLSEIALAIARFLIAGAVLPASSSGAAATAAPTFAMVVPVWPIGAALALGALAVVFRYGTDLQHRTDALQHDTEGLV